MPDTDFTPALEQSAKTRVARGELAAKLDRLRERYSDPWKPVQEPHDYKDGTTHFTHVRYEHDSAGGLMSVEVASHVTPELAELLCLLHNNLDEIVGALRGRP